MSIYLDCAATTPTDLRVSEIVTRYMLEDFGNAGSRTHDFGRRARAAVELAREQTASVVGADPDEVVFTGGATESNNMAILGLAAFGQATERRHIVSTAIEHRAVLEPLKALAARGFDVEFLRPSGEGWISPEAVKAALRADTLLVSVMHANNETGVIQPIANIAEMLGEHEAFFHVDAAQGFAKDPGLTHHRIDLITCNAHKIFGPKGVGALITRKRRLNYPPLTPLQYGGGQERGLRSGTRPVPLISGLGLAAQLASDEKDDRRRRCEAFRKETLAGLAELAPDLNGDSMNSLPHILNLSFEGIDSERAVRALDGVIAVSNGPACSDVYRPSHVLTAMGLAPDRVSTALRLSWCHVTASVDWKAVRTRLHDLSPRRQENGEDVETASPTA